MIDILCSMLREGLIILIIGIQVTFLCRRRELETICLKVTKVCRTETTVITGI